MLRLLIAALLLGAAAAPAFACYYPKPETNPKTLASQPSNGHRSTGAPTHKQS
jgi:hypothetical protein